jgi:hypothetical protein
MKHGLRKTLVSEIPEHLLKNTNLELIVDMPGKSKDIFIDFYIGSNSVHRNYVGFIGVSKGKKEAYFSIESCANANMDNIFCNKAIYDGCLPEQKCADAGLCDQVRDFIIKYAKKHGLAHPVL